mmetsp:Transcript_20099/g.45497  ORF Transcript_20099/g.45497 Transcript_20099/m.45497 type:complete len:279 (+) Transcript_20099:1071-1907(+)
MKAGSSASTHSVSHSEGSSAASASCHHTSRPSTISMVAAQSGVPSRFSTMVASTGSPPISSTKGSAASTIPLSATSFPPRITPSCAITTLAPQSTMREASASLLNPPNTTECTAPRRAHASIATQFSGTWAMNTATRSPFLTPLARSAWASLFTSLRSSEYVYESGWYAALSPTPFRSAYRATWSPNPAATWRSRQLNARLVVDPLNHSMNTLPLVRSKLYCRPLAASRGAPRHSNPEAISAQNAAGSSMLFLYIALYCSMLSRLVLRPSAAQASGRS